MLQRGMNSLGLKVQQGLGRNPHSGELFCFRGRRGQLIKIVWQIRTSLRWFWTPTTRFRVASGTL
jgi:transposase